jgi:Protein of unknown function (DUF1153)
VIRRKAEIVAAVRGEPLSLEEAFRRYTLTIDEFRAWEASLDRHGFGGLKPLGCNYTGVPYTPCRRAVLSICASGGTAVGPAKILGPMDTIGCSLLPRVFGECRKLALRDNCSDPSDQLLLCHRGEDQQEHS